MPEQATIPAIDEAKQWLAKYRLVQRHKFEIKRLTAEMKAIEETVSEDFIANAIGSIKVDGATLYIQRSLFAGVVPEKKSDAVAIATANGYGDLAGLQSQKLTALCKHELGDLVEQEGDPEALKAALPEWLQEIVNVHVKHALRARGAGMADEIEDFEEEGDE